MVKPTGATCNLRCSYCYYLGKSTHAADGTERTTQRTAHTDRAARQTVMSHATLELFTRQYLEAQTARDVLFTWHGGEPMLLPLSFYEEAMRLQRVYAGGRHVDNCIQTNGTLLTDDWCRFLHDNGWLVGLSIDGTADMHDRYRRTAGGQATHAQVMRAVEKLNRYGVEWNAMAVVNDYNAQRPSEFYGFFKAIDCRYIQFTPIVERLCTEATTALASPADPAATMMPGSITPEAWGDFLIAIFDEWVRADVGTFFLPTFDAVLANWCGVAPGICSFGATCGQAGVMEADGTVYSCDHFVFPQYRLGNIHREPLTALMLGDRQRRFGLDKRSALPRQCRQCAWLAACNGGCPKDRFARTPSGEAGLNYLCEGYRRFFAHAAPYMDFMRDEWLAGRAPANVMQWQRRR